MLVARPTHSSIYEIQRAQQELQQLSISKFKVIINNYIEESHEPNFESDEIRTR